MDNDLRLFSFIFIPLQTILLTIIHHIISAKVLKINKVKTKINRKTYKYVRCINKFVLLSVKRQNLKALRQLLTIYWGGAELAKEAR